MSFAVYDYAGVGGEELRRAETEAEHILGRAGIETEWLACHPLARSGDTECPAAGPSTLVLRLVPRFVLVPNRVGRDTMGYTTANVLTLSVELAKAVSSSGAAPLGEVLGLIIAHEAGHAFLGPRHSVSGIMRARWGLRDWELANRNGFLFHPRQAIDLRKALRARITGDIAAQRR